MGLETPEIILGFRSQLHFTVSLYGTLAEWLRRSPAKAVGYACVSSNLTGVDTFYFWSNALNDKTINTFYPIKLTQT
jgi:hypothetical protein